MKVLLLAVGMQGKATLYDLACSAEVSEVIAADREVEALRAHVQERGYGPKVRCAYVDAADPDSHRHLMGQEPDVAIDLLPVPFIGQVAAAAVESGVHLVNTFYALPEMLELAAAARARGVTLLPEFGLDPGINLVLLGQAVRALDQVDELISYGAGIPEPQATDNPLRYKVSWTFEGVLRSYLRAGRVVREGRLIEVAADEMFSPEQIHHLEIEGLGRLEALPNGDVLKYVRLLGLDEAKVRDAGRYALRWPGHCAFWHKVAQLHLLDEGPVMVDGVAVDRRRFLAAALEPQLQYQPHERDVVIVHVDVGGTRAGQRLRGVYQVIDRRDLQTGHLAMNRTVVYTASIGAQMIGCGQITKRGVLSPVTDVPYEPFVQALAARGVHVSAEVSAGYAWS